VIDFHCHIDLYSDPVATADRCVAENVHVLSVTTAPSAWRKSRELLERDGRVRVALGLHPQIAHLRYNEIEIFRTEIDNARYVGEIGLDGAPEFREHWKIQNSVFEQLLETTEQAGGRVMSLHCRHAAGTVLASLGKYPNAGLPILHWFSGSFEELKRAEALGCWFSVGPTMLSGERGRSIAARMPRDRVLTETDGPFAKFRGNTLSPWDARFAVSQLASVWEVPEKEVKNQLHENLREIAAYATP
jgi:TatD DNase family protein